ncbi:hypothetical protein PG988_004725 [Apiospora saccharicola]
MDLLPVSQTSQGPDSLCTTCEAIDWAEITRLSRDADPSYVQTATHMWSLKVQPAASKIASFPAVVKDSIEVTLGFNYRYLWVDRHCIDQNSAHKQHIINRMDQVYSQASIVIIAATGDSADDGLPGISVSREPQLEFPVGSFTFRQIPPYDLENVKHTKWATRGWTYQEGYLSRRRLFFTKVQTIFVCDEMLFPESIACGAKLQELNAALGLTSGLIANDGFHYMHLVHNVHEYSLRNLTHDSDSLQAFLGVLNDYNNSGIRQLHHLWGVPILQPLPGREPCIALDWKHTSSQSVRRRSGFPSWSWTGWAGEVFLPSDLRTTLSTVYLDQERKRPLEAVYQNLSSSNAPPRLLYLRSDVTEVTFIPGERVKPFGERYPRQVHPEVFAILPITGTVHMVCTTFMDETVEMMTPYPAILLKEHTHYKYSTHEEQLLSAPKATLLVVRETDTHFERVGLVKVGQLVPFGDRGSMPCGFSSSDLSKDVVELSQLADPIPLRQHKWLRNAEEKTICLG